ncbi:hypothetical protein BJ973_004516 [Actinoplanes tereljensis]|uniref:Uncharacterized protein n=1 Tax=Paractinoplanes tereljensis TaxID=571912 RepID=A0A919NSH7_9ACTN|nr:hypothetical protein [Actinoplanes tereljensis]GIF23903.1 hypothetical protein Ate02nite_66330 [Actinoplanes tereljensis]
MRWLALYLRSRRAPAALVVAVLGAVLMWGLWSVFSNSREVGVQMVILTVLLLVAALTATLSGPDDALEKTAALRWPPRRAAHLLVALLVVVVPLLVTLATGARFGPAGLVVRDAAGLLGLTALGAATIGTARAWFLPLGWTLGAVLFPHSDQLIGRILTWQAQAPASVAAGLTAGLLAAAGLMAYARGVPAATTAASP